MTSPNNKVPGYKYIMVINEKYTFTFNSINECGNQLEHTPSTTSVSINDQEVTVQQVHVWNEILNANNNSGKYL